MTCSNFMKNGIVQGTRTEGIPDGYCSYVCGCSSDLMGEYVQVDSETADKKGFNATSCHF